MSTWRLRWNFNSRSLKPGDSGTVSFWLQNLGETTLFLLEVGVAFDWMEGKCYKTDCGVQIPARSNRFVSNIRFEIPKTVVGQRRYDLNYHLYEFDELSQSWIDLGSTRDDQEFYVNVFPAPRYRAFVSRGLKPEDKAVGDPIVEVIREWGFDTTTVGIERLVDPNRLSPEIRNEIIASDCLVAVATRRYLDAFAGLWRTLEWLHGEVGIAFGVDRPILILRDEEIALGGLPSTFEDSQLPLNLYNIDDVRAKVATVMPSLREAIAAKRSQELRETIAKVAMGAVAVIGAGVAGYLLGSSEE